MRSILVATKFDVGRDPRPKRIAQCLLNEYEVTVLGSGNSDGNNIDFIPIMGSKKRSIQQKISNLMNNLLGRFQKIVDSMDYLTIQDLMKQKKFDLVFCHDLDFLPSILKYKNNAKIIFDAREYYPAQYDDQLLWRLFQKRLKLYLCNKYIGNCDKVITVSKNIAMRYSKDFGINVEELQSWPNYHDLSPGAVDGEKIRIIHHGGANSNRKIEKMIETMDYVDSRFSLDLMLLYENSSYYNYLVEEVKKRSNVRIIDPVKYDEIIPYTNHYDIGMFLCPPTTFNLKYALPNKLFEYIQARLLVAIGPSVEMKNIVNEYQLGIISEDFSPKTMATALCKLNKQDIEKYKSNADYAAKKFNAEANCIRVKKIVEEVLTE